MPADQVHVQLAHDVAQRADIELLHPRLGAQQLRELVDLGQQQALLDPTDLPGRGDVVLDEHDRALAAREVYAQGGIQVVAAGRIEVRGRLVEHQQVGIRRDRAREGEALPAAAREVARVVVAPLPEADRAQGGLGAGEDLDRYPRTLDADLKIAEQAGADLVFAPSADEVYPGGEPQVRITAGPMGERLEGASRPGHFDGMLTVVAKLLHLTRADVALFGQKDAQQLMLIRRMVADLDYPVEIKSVPIVRSEKGLALSSRNALLNEQELEAALVLHRSIELIAGRAARNEPLNIDDAIGLYQMEPLAELDYFVVVNPETLQELAFNCQDTPFTGEALVLVAAKIGNVRLIDNQPISG